MHFGWSVAFPNLLIGLREGLEAGLVVSILVAAVRRLAPERSLAAVWTGVAGAVAVSLSFGAILTFTEASMSSKAQEAFAGGLSVAAVTLVTFMVFWMRRTARSLSGDLKAKVGSALALSGTALVVTVFVAVAREGLETALFIWTNTQTAGSDLAPLAGAAAGLLIATVLCAGMYRRVLKINLSRFFTVTGVMLVVIAAGVLAYGLKDLQDAGVVTSATAFDVSGRAPSGTWWVQIVQGVLNLTPQMTWLQVIAYVAYLATVMALFLRRTRPATPPTTAAATVTAQAPTPASETGARTSSDPAAVAAPGTVEASVEAGIGAPMRRRPRRHAVAVGGVIVLVPALVAGVIVATRYNSAARSGQKISLSEKNCTSQWDAPKAGRSTFVISNQSGRAVDIELISAGTTAITAEIEVLGPGTTRDLSADLAAGRYAWRCAFDGMPARLSPAALVTGHGTSGQVRLPVTQADMKAPLSQYASFVAGQLSLLKRQVAALRADLAGGDLGAARADWLTAHLTWHRIGAAYDAFGDAGKAVDGLAQGLAGGVHDRGFTGFHKIEYDLWHGVPASQMTAEATALSTAIDELDAKLPTFTFDAKNVSTRAHEILEDTLRFQLTGQDDYGSGTSMASALADLEGERALLNILAPLINARSPHLVASATADFDTLEQTINATRHDGQWTAIKNLALTQRQAVNAAIGQTLETLAPVPDLLEIQK